MAPIDGMLKLFVDQGGDELQLAAGAHPKMFQRGSPMKLALPLTPDDMLRHLLGELITGDREEELRGRGVSEFDYTPQGSSARFHVSLRQAAAGLAATFRVGGRSTTQPIPRTAPPAAARSAIAPAARPAEPVVVEPTSVDGAPAELLAARASTGVLRIASDGPLGALLGAACSALASDLHLADDGVPVARVDGVLRQLGRLPIVSVVELFEELGAGGMQEATAGHRALDGALDFEDRRVRYHVYRAAEGVVAALRLLPGVAPTLASLELPVDLSDLALLPGGLILVCGPTGSGKSATLAALAQEAVRRRSALLVTLEDPIEYRVQAGAAGLVRQRQIGRDVRDFPSGLREALREDPDVLLVGEMRDPESVALALTAAETGHLVLASIHSRTAASAIERIVDATGRRDSEVRAQLAQSLRVVISQRLIPRARGAGRVAALEVLRVNHAVAALLRDGKTPQIATTLQSSRKEGMVPLDACLADLVRAGAVSRDAAAAAANDLTALSDYLAGRS